MLDSKCFFVPFQGLERHLLGSHGLVTASMQDLANKGQDSGRCPVCGKMFHWKLLNHVAKDHQKTLKPAHLSYKCTVCTATFGQYKLFENHVYSAHRLVKNLIFFCFFFFIQEPIEFYSWNCPKQNYLSHFLLFSK